MARGKTSDSVKISDSVGRPAKRNQNNKAKVPRTGHSPGSKSDHSASPVDDYNEDTKLKIMKQLWRTVEWIQKMRKQGLCPTSLPSLSNCCSLTCKCPDIMKELTAQQAKANLNLACHGVPIVTGVGGEEGKKFYPHMSVEMMLTHFNSEDRYEIHRDDSGNEDSGNDSDSYDEYDISIIPKRCLKKQDLKKQDETIRCNMH